MTKARRRGAVKRVLVKRLLAWAAVATCMLLLTSCGLLTATACMGTPARLEVHLESEVLEVARGSSGSVEVTVTGGLSEQCFPQATSVHLDGLPEGVTAESPRLTAREPRGLLTITAQTSAALGSYQLKARSSVYFGNHAHLMLVVLE